MSINPSVATRAWRRRCLFLIVLTSLVPIACSPPGPKMVKVQGRVTYQGNPVPKGTVSFQSTQPDRRNATGEIDSNGYYTLQTELPGDGAEEGAYYVTIAARDNPVLDYIPKTPVPPKFLVPEKYEKPETSGIIQTVSRSSGAINLELKD